MSKLLFPSKCIVLGELYTSYIFSSIHLELNCLFVLLISYYACMNQSFKSIISHLILKYLAVFLVLLEYCLMLSIIAVIHLFVMGSWGISFFFMYIIVLNVSVATFNLTPLSSFHADYVNKAGALCLILSHEGT